MGTPLDELLDILDLETIEQDVFRGRTPPTSLQRIFGGQVAGQALVAAGRTVPADRQVHSLHAYFLRPGDPNQPVLYLADRIRDGRSFTTRRVVAVQHGKAIFNLSASFQVPEDGVAHADPMPAVPGPEQLPTWEELVERYADQLAGRVPRSRPIDVRYVGEPPFAAAPSDPQRGTSSQVWMRADGQLPDDPLLHVCALTYASDMTLLDTVVRPHGLTWWTGNVAMASLDHAMWFHGPFRADEWFLYDQHSPAAAGARGLATGRIFTRDGHLVVSVVQEGLVRRLPGAARRGTGEGAG